MYKVLEVREYNNTSKGSFHNSYGGSGGSVDVVQRHIIAVICENEETNKRERFEFYKGYEDKVLRETCYFGYTGDYDLLIVGDRFEIKETRTYKQVVITK